MTQVCLELSHRNRVYGSKRLTLELHESDLSDAIIFSLKEAKEALQARRSGLAICIHLGDDFPTPDGVVGADNGFRSGQVFFNPEFKEFCLAYGEVDFRDNSFNRSDCLMIGYVVDADKGYLEAVGESIWHDGARVARISAA